MGNIGFGEIATIALLALIVIGPKRLPEIMRNLGKAWRTFQVESQKAKSALTEALDEETMAELRALDADTRGQLNEFRKLGVIDQPGDAPAAKRTKPARAPTPEEIEAAAVVEVAPERELEDT